MLGWLRRRPTSATGLMAMLGRPVDGWATWPGEEVGARAGRGRAGWRGRLGQGRGRAGWRFGLFGFPIFLSPFLIPYLFIPLLYLLPNAPKLVYMCCQHVQLLVGSSRGYLRFSGVHVKGWHRWALIYKEGRLTL